MTRDEVIDLLTMAAAYDLRTVGASDVSAWHAVADSQGWTFATARRALVEHYGTETDRIMPGHISARLADVRRSLRTQAAGVDVRAPAEYRDDPRREAQYVRAQQQQFVEHGLQQWANGYRALSTTDGTE